MKIRARSVRSCGKICLAHGVCYAMRRRPPRGGRGLKHAGDLVIDPIRRSPPARGAWIETADPQSCLALPASPPARGAWIETLLAV